MQNSKQFKSVHAYFSGFLTLFFISKHIYIHDTLLMLHTIIQASKWKFLEKKASRITCMNHLSLVGPNDQSIARRVAKKIIDE